jgi:hypothetical protein
MEKKKGPWNFNIPGAFSYILFPILWEKNNFYEFIISFIFFFIL